MWSLHLSFAKRKCITPLPRLATMSECNLHSRCHAELEGIDFLVKVIYIYCVTKALDNVRAGNKVGRYFSNVITCSVPRAILRLVAGLKSRLKYTCT